MKLVIALGGNALLTRGGSLDIHVQRANVSQACESIAPLTSEHRVIMTHGNGPQMGLLALQAAAYAAVDPYPLDVLGAESEGMIGYLLEQGFMNRLPGMRTANLITQTLIDAEDPAFLTPIKFIGPIYTTAEAKEISQSNNWIVKPDGKHFRRVVPSPLPQKLLALGAIKILSDAGYLVICTGGGGIPVVQTIAGEIKGVEAVIDKDRASALLAREIGADVLLLLTDVDAVYQNWGTDSAKAIRKIRISDVDIGSFAAGSMGPKVEAACRFVRETGKRSAIGSLNDAVKILHGVAGTTITP